MTKAWILNIGNELLLGTIVNTNGAWLARKLSFMGVKVDRIVMLPDEEEHVVSEIKSALARKVDILITTGGLGPTYDDRTLEFISKATGKELEINEEALRMVREFYTKAGMQLSDDRIKMAKMPRGATPIPNPVGAAPGCLLEVNKTLIIALPGVPREMQEMFEKHVEKLLSSKLPSSYIEENFVCIKGVPESTMAPILKRLVSKYPNTYLKSHPKGHEATKPLLKIQVLVRGRTRNEAATTLNNVMRSLMADIKELGGIIIECTEIE